MLRKQMFLSAVLVSTSLMVGCARYKPAPLMPSFGDKQTSRNVEASAHTLNASDCSHFFSRNTDKKGYKAIQVTINNKSNATYMLNGRSINLNLVSIERISKVASIKAFNRGIIWIAPSLVIFSPLLFIIGVCDGAKSASANRRMKRDFRERCIDTNSIITIQPNSLINRVMFVKNNDYSKKLCLSLDATSEKTESISFKLSI